MRENWIAIGRYIAVIVTSLLLAFVLGSTDLFEKTAVVSGKLSASHVVRFLGYGGSLVVFWLTVKRLTVILNEMEGHWHALRHVVLPLGTLVVVLAGHSVLLLMVAPLMSSGMKEAYNWAFILASIAVSVWLIAAMFNQSSSITELLVRKMGRGDPAAPVDVDDATPS